MVNWDDWLDEGTSKGKWSLIDKLYDSIKKPKLSEIQTRIMGEMLSHPDKTPVSFGFLIYIVWNSECYHHKDVSKKNAEKSITRAIDTLIKHGLLERIKLDNKEYAQITPKARKTFKYR